MCILLDLGLRVGEVTRLVWSDIDPTNEHLTFYRPKVHTNQTLRLSETRATHWSVTASSSIFMRPCSSAPHRNLAGF
jgi:integrase